MTNINTAITLVIGVALISILFMVIPMIGENVDDAWTAAPQAKATGTLTFTDVPLDGDTFNISLDRYEFDPTGDGVAAGNFDINTGTVAVTMGNVVTCVNANDTTGVLATNTSTTVVLTADAYGTAGNAITTTEDGTKTSFGAATLTGGLTASDWNATVNTDLQSGDDIWTDLASMISIGVLLIIISGIILKPLLSLKR